MSLMQEKMSVTPTKSAEVMHFIPKEILSPNKDNPGISKTVYSHVSKLHSLLSDWMKVKEKGVKLCRVITSLKLHECNDDYYPHQLKPVMESLLDALDSFKNIVEGARILNDQLKALAILQPTNEPAISTWSATQISSNIDKIYTSLLKEYKLKHVIIENIAHCRDEKLIEVYVSSWEFEAYLNMELHAYLFAEVGLPGIM